MLCQLWAIIFHTRPAECARVTLALLLPPSPFLSLGRDSAIFFVGSVCLPSVVVVVVVVVVTKLLWRALFVAGWLNAKSDMKRVAREVCREGVVKPDPH